MGDGIWALPRSSHKRCRVGCGRMERRLFGILLRFEGGPWAERLVLEGLKWAATIFWFGVTDFRYGTLSFRGDSCCLSFKFPRSTLQGSVRNK